MNIVNLHIGKLNLCYVAYIQNGRERERENTLQDHVMYNKMRIANTILLRILYGKLYLCYVAYVYNGELVSLIGNQRVGIFPPKSEILFYLSLAFTWCQNSLDWSIPVEGDTWPILKTGNLFPSWEISDWEFSHQNQIFSSPWEYLSFGIIKSRIGLLL